MQRTRLYDCRISGLPESVGLCNSDLNGTAAVVNAAQRRLLYCKEAGEESWWGTFAEIRFVLSRAQPYVTFDRDVARLELVDVCDYPVDVNNQFAEYLRFGNGRMPKLFRQTNRNAFAPQVYTRNNVPTMVDLSGTGQYIRAYYTDSSDAGKRVLIQGLDSNNNVVYSQDGLNRAVGQFEALSSPFVQWPMTFNSITGIQKDVTNYPVQIFQVDPATGAQVLLATMQPTETTAWYRRYYFHNLPCNCCSQVCLNPCSPTVPAPSVVVTAIVKLEFNPVIADTDYCLIGNVEALKEEAMAVRYSTMDSAQSKQLEAIKHRNAVRYLNGELTHYLGKDTPATNLAVFGSAKLERRMIGNML